MKAIVSGTYGSGKTPCNVFIYRDHNGLNWYCVEDSGNINATYEDLYDGVDVEMLQDVDCIQGCEPIQSLDELAAHIEDR